MVMAVLLCHVLVLKHCRVCREGNSQENNIFRWPAIAPWFGARTGNEQDHRRERGKELGSVIWVRSKIGEMGDSR